MSKNKNSEGHQKSEDQKEQAVKEVTFDADVSRSESELNPSGVETPAVERRAQLQEVREQEEKLEQEAAENDDVVLEQQPELPTHHEADSKTREQLREDDLYQELRSKGVEEGAARIEAAKIAGNEPAPQLTKAQQKKHEKNTRQKETGLFRTLKNEDEDDDSEVRAMTVPGGVVLSVEGSLVFVPNVRVQKGKLIH